MRSDRARIFSPPISGSCALNSYKHGFPACTSPYVKVNSFNCINKIATYSSQRISHIQPSHAPPSPVSLARHKFFTVSWGRATLQRLQTVQSTRSTPHFQNANVSSQQVPAKASIIQSNKSTACFKSHQVPESESSLDFKFGRFHPRERFLAQIESHFFCDLHTGRGGIPNSSSIVDVRKRVQVHLC